jgi:Putative nucleotidyltransferase DUF294
MLTTKAPTARRAVAKQANGEHCGEQTHYLSRVSGPSRCRGLDHSEADSVRPGLSKTSYHDAAPPAESVRHVLRAIAGDPSEARDRKRWLTRVRPLVDRSHATLRARFEADGSVTAFLRGRTRLADGAVIGLLHLARAVVRSDAVVTPIAPVTVLAVGGYGRQELAPASDLDLLFLLGDPNGRAHAERLIGFVLTGLWDLGFEVGSGAPLLSTGKRQL